MEKCINKQKEIVFMKKFSMIVVICTSFIFADADLVGLVDHVTYYGGHHNSSTIRGWIQIHIGSATRNVVIKGDDTERDELLAMLLYAKANKIVVQINTNNDCPTCDWATVELIVLDP